MEDKLTSEDKCQPLSETAGGAFRVSSEGALGWRWYSAQSLRWEGTGRSRNGQGRRCARHLPDTWLNVSLGLCFIRNQSGSFELVTAEITSCSETLVPG